MFCFNLFNTYSTITIAIELHLCMLPLQIHLLPMTITGYILGKCQEKSLFRLCSVYLTPFHSLTQRDFIDTCITDSTTNSRNSNVGVLIEGRTDYSMLSNIDPDTHFLSSNNIIIFNYYFENEFNHVPNLNNKIYIFNVIIRNIFEKIDRLRHYLLELNHKFSVISIFKLV